MAKAVKELAVIEPAPLVPTSPVDTLLAQAIDKGVDIATMEKLLAMREKLQAEHARAAFFQALASFQGACPIIPKTKTATIQSRTGGSYKYSFAPLDVIVKHVSPLMEQFGLSFTVETRHEDKAIVAIVTVHHVAGYSQSSEFRAPIEEGARMNAMQQVASAQTYAKRYAFCNALGILTGDDDDDAHAVTGEAQGRGPRPLAPPRQKAAGAVESGPFQPRPAAPPPSAETPAAEPEPAEVRAAFGLTGNADDEPVSRPELIQFFAAAREHGKKDPEIKKWLKAAFGLSSSKDMLRSQYDRAMRWARLDP